MQGRGKKGRSSRKLIGATPAATPLKEAGATLANDDGADSAARPAFVVAQPGSNHTTIRGVYSTLGYANGAEVRTMGGRRHDGPVAPIYRNPHTTPFEHLYDDVFAPCVLKHVRTHTKQFPTPSVVDEALQVYMDTKNPDIHATMREASEEMDNAFMQEIAAVGATADRVARKPIESTLVEKIDARALELLKDKLRHIATKDILETLMDDIQRDSITEVPNTFVRQFKRLCVKTHRSPREINEIVLC